MVATPAHPNTARFDASHAEHVPPFRLLPGVEDVEAVPEASIEDRLFDTVDRRLARQGLALFRRTGGMDAGWHLKSLDAADGRREPLGTSDQPPAALTDGLQVHIRGRALVPSGEIRTAARRWRLLASDGGALAEVESDDVRVVPLDPTSAPRMLRLWNYELWTAAGPELTVELPAMFAESGAEPAQLDPLRIALAPGPSRAAEPRGVFPAYVSAQLERLIEQDPLVRAGEQEAVHKMRVACRRLRSALSTFKKEAGPQQAQLRAELRWIARRLGQVRDADVMRARLRDLIAAESGDLIMGPVAQGIEEQLGAEHRHAAEGLAEALVSERYFSLLDSVEELERRLAGRPARTKKVSKIVRKDSKRLRKAVRAAAASSGSPDAVAALHTARKAAKRLRYAADAAKPLGKPKARKLSRRAERLQDVLGEHHDSIVTAGELRRLGVEAYLRGENAFTFGLLYGRQLQRAAEAEDGFEDLRKRLPAKLGGLS
ncbi:CYTH and CHAD domain-containing protein [Sinomonas albida]|uniref:CYTH and CHAD domain-containing protein n=1 Tax=Sinomonas albida TaxID=369942 RepID=UPI0010A7691F|nr:CYTH and CHAD domain-containing protein [Sinomonas albida]